MKNLISRFVRDDSGSAAVEYSLITALVGVASIVALGGLSDSIDAGLNAASNAITDAIPTNP